LGKNKLTQIDASLCRLKKLRFLDVSDNNIVKLTNDINQLINLEVLILNNNLIEKTDDLNIPKLRIIELSGNKLSEICQQILNLSNLKKIRINGNKISDRDIQCIKKNLSGTEVIH
jgi:Leucine-rich repeat (LRR) protein